MSLFRESALRCARMISCVLISGIFAGCGGGGGDKPNAPPQIVTTSLSTDEDVVLSTTISATDPDGNALSFSATSQPQHGTLQISSNGSVTYSPASNFSGSDGFTVLVTDSKGASASGSISIVVRAVNDAPAVSPTAFSGIEEATISASVSASDIEGDAFGLALAQQAAHGVVTFQASGSFSYVPQKDFAGTDTFSIESSDVHGARRVHAITLRIEPVNDPPIAHNDELRIPNGVSSVPILANDVDVDGDNLTVTILSQGRGGTVSASGSVVTFVRENSFEGPTEFQYRITDAAGITSDATAKLVIGDFPGVVLLADESELGVRELHLYDGFRTRRLSTPLQPGTTLEKFFVGPDRRHVAYVVAATTFSQVLLIDIANPGSAKVIHTSGPFTSDFEVELNRDATFALVRNSTDASPLHMRLVRVSDGSSRPVGSGNPEIVQGNSIGVFNPVTDEFYLRAQVGGQPPPWSGTGYTSLFSATINAPESLARVGADYSASAGGSGSGWNLKITPDGRSVLHASFKFTSPTPSTTSDLLINDRSGSTESFVYRPFGAYEFPSPAKFGLSRDGTRVCYTLQNTTTSEHRLWFSDLNAPGSGTALSPFTSFVGDCVWASDNRHVVYASYSGAQQPEPWMAETSQPGQHVRIREPLAAGELVDYFAIAKTNMTAVVGVRPAGSVIPDFYRVSLDAPGTSTKFAVGSFLISPSQATLNDQGTLLTYRKNEPVGGGLQTITRVRMMSSQTNSYDWPVSRPDATAGVLQYALVELP